MMLETEQVTLKIGRVTRDFTDSPHGHLCDQSMRMSDEMPSTSQSSLPTVRGDSRPIQTLRDPTYIFRKVDELEIGEIYEIENVQTGPGGTMIVIMWILPI
jgi:hypothetical protein